MSLSTNISDRARANMKAYAQDPRINDHLKSLLRETIQANRGKSREQVIAAFEARKQAYVKTLQRRAVDNARASVIPTMKKKALDELIEERLKLQEAAKLSITVTNAEVDKVFLEMAQRNKMTAKQFENQISSQGASANVIKDRLRASLSWRDVVRKRYGHYITVTNREVEDLAAKSGQEENLELKLQKLTISTPGKVSQQAMASRLIEANGLRQRFRGCQSMAGLAKSQTNARFQNLGFVKPSSVAEPTRSLLLAAKDGDMLPANLAADGVELYAVCGRRSTSTVSESSKEAARSKLTMLEFEKLSQRYLYDLRKDALIEMR
ncbi:MAG: SurA N-terminal domain-containing protein [Hyphomicrobiaceae bacterium]